MKEAGDINIIPKGKLHKENNNLGNGDKGIPVVDGSKKVYELEKEELILRLSATQKAEELHKQYLETEDDSILEELGRFVTDELLNNTEDKSGRYGLTVEKDEDKDR